MASTEPVAHKAPLGWLRTRRRKLAAAVGAVVLIATVTIAVTAGPSRPTRAADQTANQTTPAAPTKPLAITPAAVAPGVVAATVPPTKPTQGPVAASPSTVPPAPSTTSSLSPPAAAKPTTTISRAVSLAALPKGWLTLAGASGSAGSTTKVFHLQDHNTRLRYSSSGVSLTIFVVDAKRGLDATAGYAAAECAGTCSNGWMSLHNPPGDYYLLVQATGGRWAVDISEFSGPVQ